MRDTNHLFNRNQAQLPAFLPLKNLLTVIQSQTGAMADLFEGEKDRLADYLKAFHLVDSQVGGLFAIYGKVAGLECFSHWQTFSKFFKKLVQSYALDAINFIHGQGTNIPISEETILKFHQMIRGEIWDAGKFKEKDRDIIEKFANGRQRVRFKAVKAEKTTWG